MVTEMSIVIVMVKQVFVHDLTLTYVVVVFLLSISLQSPHLTHDVPYHGFYRFDL